MINLFRKKDVSNSQDVLAQQVDTSVTDTVDTGVAMTEEEKINSEIISESSADTGAVLVLRKPRKHSKISKFGVVSIICLSILAFFQLLPFWIKLVNSMHSPDYLPAPGAVDLWFSHFTFVNYGTAIEYATFFQSLLVSLIHTICYTGLSLVVALICGYVFAKKEFRGKSIVVMMMMSTLMVPGEVLMSANYRMTIFFGINDSILGIILPGIVNITGIFLIQQFMVNVPDSVLESAEIDGCNEARKLLHIVTPMAVPIIMTYIILTFISTWNEYLFPMILYSTSGNIWLKTLQISMQSFNPNFGGAADEYVRSAGMILITIPIVIMYLVAQRYILEGANISGMK